MIEVVLVDSDDNVIGREEKLNAHRSGALHRAFSVFVINKNEELLLQQRSSDKYHSPDLWSNTCCSHPLMDENIEASAQKRLMEEMGFTCPLHWLFKFEYRIEFPNGLIEHELDHVFLGYYDFDPNINTNEVKNWEWRNVHQIETELESNPEKYTYWFKHVFQKFYSAYLSFEKEGKR